MTHRQRQIQNDVEAYRKRQAENMKKWREANPEKVKVINDKKKQKQFEIGGLMLCTNINIFIKYIKNYKLSIYIYE